jgi:hypothetical protein
MAINTQQEYVVTITIHPLDVSSLQATVTQAGETVIGIANGASVAEAFDLAHADYVEQLSEQSRKRFLAILNEN